MLIFSIIVAFLVPMGHGADHELFKNCSRVPFCAKMRNQVVNESSQFTAVIQNIQVLHTAVIIPLEANETVLQLRISFIDGDKIRIKVLELNHSRYELTDVLVGEPSELTMSDMVIQTSAITLFPSATNRLTVRMGPPFSIECYDGDQLLLVINSDRLLMENSDSSQAFSFGVTFAADKLYGLSHHAYRLALGETADGSSDPFRLRNSDTSGYETGSPMALYGSIPVIYGHSTNGTSGIFLHNAAEQWVDISYNDSIPSAYFMVESGAFDLFVLVGPTPKKVIRQYISLTGVPHLPQLWTLGYHQSRWSYYTQEDVKNVVATMDAHDFPMDAIWLDIDYTDDKKYFTWNPENFSDPIELQRNLSSTNRKLVTILDPHIKVDPEYSVYTGAADYFVKWQNGSDFQGVCWPGLSSYIDFLNTNASNYYASLFSYNSFNGSTETLAGIWNDMNEPSVFDDSLEKTLPFETIHQGGVLHRDVHNIYGLMHTKATHQGLMQRDNGTKRPFVLTRSHFAGSQRYAAMWTGDNTADWTFLATSYAECLTANILGMVFCGADIGGFAGNPGDELLQRWYQAGAWLPFYRGHATQESQRREPYLFSQDVQKVIRDAIKIRYKHIPVWYTLFYEHTQSGDPVIRPLFYHYPEIYELETHLLLGTDILVRPVLEPNVPSVSVFFPGSDTKWYRADDDSWSVHNGSSSENVTVDISTSPFYYKAGTIIARKDRDKPSTTDMIDDPFTLYVNLNSENNAVGRFYIDDYTSFEYTTKNSYLYLNFTYIAASHGIYFQIIDGNSEGFIAKIQQVVIHSLESSKFIQSRYTTTSDGTSLETIDIAKLLRAQRNKGILLSL